MLKTVVCIQRLSSVLEMQDMFYCDSKRKMFFHTKLILWVCNITIPDSLTCFLRAGIVHVFLWVGSLWNGIDNAGGLRMLIQTYIYFLKNTTVKCLLKQNNLLPGSFLLCYFKFLLLFIVLSKESFELGVAFTEYVP